jgi:hypothetical protein
VTPYGAAAGRKARERVSPVVPEAQPRGREKGEEGSHAESASFEFSKG